MRNEKSDFKRKVKHVYSKRNKPKRITAAGVTQDLIWLLPEFREKCEIDVNIHSLSVDGRLKVKKQL